MAVETGNCKETMTESDLNRMASLLVKIAWFESLREQGVDLAPFRELMNESDPPRGVMNENNTNENKFWELMQTLPEGDYGHQGHRAENYANQVRMFVSEAGPPGWNPSTCKVNWKEYACFCNGGARLQLNLISAGVPIPEREQLLDAYFAQFDGTKEVLPFDCNTATLEDPIYVELNVGTAKSHKKAYLTVAILSVAVLGIAAWSFWPKNEEKIAERQYRLARGY